MNTENYFRTYTGTKTIKATPIGCFIPVNFSEVYNDRANDD